MESFCPYLTISIFFFSAHYIKCENMEWPLVRPIFGKHLEEYERKKNVNFYGKMSIVKRYSLPLKALVAIYRVSSCLFVTWTMFSFGVSPLKKSFHQQSWCLYGGLNVLRTTIKKKNKIRHNQINWAIKLHCHLHICKLCNNPKRGRDGKEFLCIFQMTNDRKYGSMRRWKAVGSCECAHKMGRKDGERERAHEREKPRCQVGWVSVTREKCYYDTIANLCHVWLNVLYVYEVWLGAHSFNWKF